MTSKPETNMNAFAAIREENRKIEPTETQCPTLSLSEIIQQGSLSDAMRLHTQQLAKSHREGIIEIPLTGWFLDRWIRANGRNRPRNWGHVSELAEKIRQRFKPLLTDFCLTKDGHAANGGHSGAAIAAAYVPPVYWEALGWTVERVAIVDEEGYAVPDENGNEQYSVKPYTPSIRYVKEGDGLNETIPLLTDEELADIKEDRENLVASLDAYLAAIPDTDRWVSMKVNADNNIVREYDTRTRPRTGAEQLQLYAPARSWCLTHPIFSGDFNLLAAVLRQLRLCSDKEPTRDENGNLTYGTPAGGGNTSPEIFPPMYDLFLPLLETNLGKGGANYAWDDTEGVKEKYFAIADRFELLRKFTKDMIVSACRVSKSEAKKLGTALRKDAENPALDYFVFVQRQHESGKAAKGADATFAQSLLIAAIRGQKPKIVAKGDSGVSVPHQATCRGKGWDIRQPNDMGEEYVETFRESIQAINDWFDRFSELDDVKTAPAEDKTRRKASTRKPRKAKATS